MRWPGGHGAGTPLGQGRGGQGTSPSSRASHAGHRPALRDRREHNFPKRRGRAPSLLCQSCWRRWQLHLRAAASAVPTAPRCETSGQAGLSIPRPPGRAEGWPLPARDVYTADPALPAAPGAAPPAEGQPGGGSGGAGTGGERAGNGREGGGRHCPRRPVLGARRFHFCGHGPERSAGSRIQRHRRGHHFRGQRRAAAGPPPLPAGQGRAGPFPTASLFSSLPPLPSIPTLRGRGGSRGRSGTLQAE